MRLVQLTSSKYLKENLGNSIKLGLLKQLKNKKLVSEDEYKKIKSKI